MSGNSLWCRKCRSHHHPTDTCEPWQRSGAPPSQQRAPVRESKEHILKTWPYFFQATLEGRKLFEVRDSSEAIRDFQVGDTLRLVEWDEGAEEYTGRALECQVGYTMRGGRFGLPTHMCVMSITDVKESHVYLDDHPPAEETP